MNIPKYYSGLFYGLPKSGKPLSPSTRRRSSFFGKAVRAAPRPPAVAAFPWCVHENLLPTHGGLYARLTWLGTDGKRRDKKRKALDKAHARTMLAEMMQELAINGGLNTRPKRGHYNRITCFIYCIQILDGHINPIKVGITNNVNKRIKNMLTSTPYEIKLLASWVGGVQEERETHKLFVQHKIAREWFHPHPEIIEYVSRKNNPSARAELVTHLTRRIE